MDLPVAVASADVGDMMDGFNLTYETRLNYNTSLLFGDSWAKPGNLYAGGYHIWNAGSRLFQTFDNGIPNRSGGLYSNLQPNNTRKYPGNAFYVGWNQEWYKGIGTNVGFLYQNSAPIITAYTTSSPGPGTALAAAQESFTSVLNVPMSAISDTFRPKDGFGLGYSWTKLYGGGARGNEFRKGLEHVGELFYRFQVNEQFSIIPSFQLIGNALGLKENGLWTVIGLRMNYKF